MQTWTSRQASGNRITLSNPCTLQFSCPGKIMLAGEYAVVHGSSAILLAVNRRASAQQQPKVALHASTFLQACTRVVRDQFGTGSNEAKRAESVRVDTDAFRQGQAKLGLGSSAATCVSAIATALGPLENLAEHVFPLARRAHSMAQKAQGSEGSGADVASCTFGGTIRFEPEGAVGKAVPLALPRLFWVFPWLAKPASTTSLLIQMHAYRDLSPYNYRQAIEKVSKAAHSFSNARTPSAWLNSIREAAAATIALGIASKLPIVPPAYGELISLAEGLGGAMKTAGAGGGDLAFAAFGEEESAKKFRQHLDDRQIAHPEMAVDCDGVRLDA